MLTPRVERTVAVGQTPVTDTATGRVRVLNTRCATCDFRPGNQGNLAPGQLARLVRDCVADEGHIVCHETGDESSQPGAICAGFAAHPDAGRSLALRIAATGHALSQEPGPVPDLRSTPNAPMRTKASEPASR
ncbi:hypothetical protein GCM10010425_20320 [Streptomyces spororaveus]|uniref:Uncharacterized protein n=1 Tax=Streptomyces spororaveus TaxID=284039 RepID=A0ABQ3T8H8_9ACTN|nr:hypothetical protein Sspor_18360 [Streptomyces spororaveus]